MRESTSVPSVNPVPPGVPTPEETGKRIAFQVDHPEVGFSPLPLCDDPEKRWTAYWLAEDGKPRHVTGPTLGDVLDTLAEKFGT